ncbi:hypothetical protein J1605_020421 [Eschrichtius robustus]|uniref:Uncharacterized protein n=1 Tax=Eschrichtius robustus TaxID=9764 RepID=A0AB34HJM9_ESCRO|nr:hypothetical protein J1605_020421 [Eschrichtius robustus]
MEGGAYGAGKAGGAFDPYTLVRQPHTILRVVSWRDLGLEAAREMFTESEELNSEVGSVTSSRLPQFLDL